MKSLKTQIAGKHYQKYVIQPAEFNLKNNIPWAEGDIINYICRWRDKNGIEDLKKARHLIDMLIENEQMKQVAGRPMASVIAAKLMHKDEDI
jgi:hypothetical protein